MPPQKYKLKILGIKDLTQDVKEFTLEKPEGASHRPGQFMTIKIDDGGEKICMRSYSVLYSPDGGNLQLGIKLVEDGRGSSWLFKLKPGDEIEVIYPAGNFLLPEELADELVFIGTGTGLVPLLCMIESFPEGFDKKVKLIFGVRYEEDLFYVDRIEKLEKQLPGFEKIFTLSRPGESWKGHGGRVTDHLENPGKNSQYFICGSAPVLKSVCDLLREKGVPDENVFHENYG